MSFNQREQFQFNNIIGSLKSNTQELTNFCHGTMSKNGYGLVIIDKNQRLVYYGRLEK